MKIEKNEIDNLKNSHKIDIVILKIQLIIPFLFSNVCCNQRKQWSSERNVGAHHFEATQLNMPFFLVHFCVADACCNLQNKLFKNS